MEAGEECDCGSQVVSVWSPGSRLSVSLRRGGGARAKQPRRRSLSSPPESLAGRRPGGGGGGGMRGVLFLFCFSDSQPGE